MSKRVGLLSGWLAATLALGFVGYAAVALVGDQVTDQPTGRVVNLSAATTLDDSFVEPAVIRGSVVDDSSVTTFDVPDPSLDGFGRIDSDATIPDGSDVPSETQPGAPTPPATSPPATAPPTGTTPPATSPPTTAPAPPPTTPPPTTTVPNDDDGSDDPMVTGPFTFLSEGGSVTVTCIEDRVRFGGASPSGGASINVLERGPQEVVVRFASGNAVWTTVVRCDGGEAFAEFD